MRLDSSQFRLPRLPANHADFSNATCFLLLLLLMLPAVAPAQFSYVTNNGTITIANYTGWESVLTVPDTINGYPVTGIGNYAFRSNTNLLHITLPSSVTNIGDGAFYSCNSLSNITMPVSFPRIGDWTFHACHRLTRFTIPNSVTSIGSHAFDQCLYLTNITIPASVTNIGDGAFNHCTFTTNITIPNGVASIASWTFADCRSLTSMTIPDSATSIGPGAFSVCIGLTSVTIGNSVTNIGDSAFQYDFKLAGVFFKGNAPGLGLDVFFNATNAIVYYLPGTTGWGPTFGGLPTKLWKPEVLTGSVGVRTNQFGFNISWASGQSVVVEACTNLANPAWFPLRTNTLNSKTSYFSEPDWTNYPARFYRLRSL